MKKSHVVLFGSAFVLLSILTVLVLVVDIEIPSFGGSAESTVFKGQNEYSVEELKDSALEHAYVCLAEFLRDSLELRYGHEPDFQLGDFDIYTDVVDHIMNRTEVQNRSEAVILRTGAKFIVKLETTTDSYTDSWTVTLEYTGGDPLARENWNQWSIDSDVPFDDSNINQRLYRDVERDRLRSQRERSR